jgi:NTE family protein
MPQMSNHKIESRPALALVLGSGGVRSIAALGVVEVLEREGIQPDLVVGCSSGALFAALVAQKLDANEAVRVATGLWTADVTRQRRWGAVPQMIWPRLGRFDANFALRDDRMMMARLRQAFGNLRIEDTGLSLRVCATDADSGEPVVLQTGCLVDALRASIAMPFLFAPRWVDGKRLIDGFVSDPLPVSAAHDAQAVLALGFDAPMPHQVDRPTRMLAQLSSSLTNNLMRSRLKAAKGEGVRFLRVQPSLDRRIGLFDTEAMPYLVERGRRAAEAMLPAIFELTEQECAVEMA